VKGAATGAVAAVAPWSAHCLSPAVVDPVNGPLASGLRARCRASPRRCRATMREGGVSSRGGKPAVSAGRTDVAGFNPVTALG
jgi:hypothetical protein